MKVGVEVLPGTIDESIWKLRQLSDVVDVVKVRRPADLAALLAAGLSFQFVLRPACEGRNLTEVLRDAFEWIRVLGELGQSGRVLRLLLWNEPQHPDSPYHHDGAERFAREIAEPALEYLPPLPYDVGASGLVPYHDIPAWAAMQARYPTLRAGGHCYQNEGDTLLAVADCINQGEGKPLGELVADEVGDTGMGTDPDLRAERIADQFHLLAEAGALAAILFPLCGYAEGSISYDVDTVRMILEAGKAVEPGPPLPGGTGLRLEELQKLAATIAVAELPEEVQLTGPDDINPNVGTFQTWLADKTVGTPMSKEIAVDDEDGGGVAVITAAGRIIHAAADGSTTVV